jgi:hypothetical protein
MWNSTVILPVKFHAAVLRHWGSFAFMFDTRKETGRMICVRLFLDPPVGSYMKLFVSAIAVI